MKGTTSPAARSWSVKQSGVGSQSTQLSSKDEPIYLLFPIKRSQRKV